MLVDALPNNPAMQVELLRQQLENLKILYEDALYNNASLEDLQKIKNQIESTKFLISNRRGLKRKNENVDRVQPDR